ncbi:MAG: hemolysin III family protein [Clostridia bacterium]|nr:hemolysin III family protein [Clostridia bacterium]
MNIVRDVKLIDYPPAVDRLNCLTHAAGALASVAGLVFITVKSYRTGDRIAVFSCVVYALSLIAVYTGSAVYHGLPPGNKKIRARLFDHLTIPLLLAGTATPCALITLRRVSMLHCIAVFVIAWLCAAFGIFGKLCFFEKLKTPVMIVYFAGSIVMLSCAIPLAKNFNKTGFLILVAGSIAYAAGSVFCRLGMKRPSMHVIFHIFTVIGSALHFMSVYFYVL